VDQSQEGNPQQDPGSRPPEHYTQDFRHAPISARVPEKIGRGVFCTAVMILQSHEEFIIDFLSTIAQPHQVASRVVMTINTFAQFIAALRANIAGYEQHFGPLIPRMPMPNAQQRQPGEGGAPSPATVGAGPKTENPPGDKPADHPQQPSIEDIYGQLKLSDEMMGGVFANVVMMGHTPEEFSFDFIANFYPRPVVVSRVYMAAGRVPSFMDALTGSYQKFQQRFRGDPPGKGPTDKGQ
jgi:hypothetical protein